MTTKNNQATWTTEDLQETLQAWVDEEKDLSEAPLDNEFYVRRGFINLTGIVTREDLGRTYSVNVPLRIEYIDTQVEPTESLIEHEQDEDKDTIVGKYVTDSWRWANTSKLERGELFDREQKTTNSEDKKDYCITLWNDLRTGTKTIYALQQEYPEHFALGTIYNGRSAQGLIIEQTFDPIPERLGENILEKAVRMYNWNIPRTNDRTVLREWNQWRRNIEHYVQEIPHTPTEKESSTPLEELRAFETETDVYKRQAFILKNSRETNGNVE